jgi:hypothetical protein
MLLLLKLLIWTVRALARSRQALLLDNLALRQQLATLVQRSGRRARLGPLDRVFWVALRVVWTDWATSLAIVKPATVVAWHRRAYRVYWRLSLAKIPSAVLVRNRWPRERAVCRCGRVSTLGFHCQQAGQLMSRQSDSLSS